METTAVKLYSTGYREVGQLFGSLGEWAWTGSAKAALQDIRIGLPGMLAQVFAGYAVLRYLLRN